MGAVNFFRLRRLLAGLGFGLLSVFPFAGVAQPGGESGAAAQTEDGPAQGEPSGEEGVFAATPDIAERTAVNQALLSLIEKRDFQGLEDLFGEVRSGRVLMIDGLPKLGFLHGELSGAIQAMEKETPSSGEKFLGEWQAQHPDSPTPRIAMAQFHIRLGWDARGSGTARTVSEKGWEKLAAHLAHAEKEIRAALDVGVADPQAYAAWITVGMGQNLGPKEQREIFEKGIEIDPSYLELYEGHAITLLPRWGGHPGELEEFARESGDRFPGPEGDLLYARIVRRIYNYIGGQGLATVHSFDWDRVKRGYLELESRCGVCVKTYAQEVELAGAYDDWEFFERALGKLGDRREYYFEGMSDERLREAFGSLPSGLRAMAEWGDARSVEMMLKGGANVNARDRKGRTALNYAIWGDRPEIVRILLRHGADPNQTFADGAPVLTNAAWLASGPVVQALVEGGAQVNAQYSNGSTALQQAARKGDAGMVRYLLERGANPNMPSYEVEWFPIHDAIRGGHVEALAALLDGGADPNLMAEGKWPALTFAIQADQPEAVRLLVAAGADLSEEGIGKVRLYHAPSIHMAEMITLLLEGGMDVNAKDAAGNPLLVDATSAGNLAIVDELLRRGADPNSSSGHGWAPLHVAIQHEQEAAAVALIEGGANPNTILDGKWSPLSMAIGKNQFETVKALLSHGADTSVKTFDHAPLFGAAVGNRPELVDLLLEAGADPHLPSASLQQTPPHGASQEGHEAVVARLLEVPGINLEAKDTRGYTPLHVAVSRKQREIARLLLAAGARRDALSNMKETPLDMARNAGDPDLIAMLEAGT